MIVDAIPFGDNANLNGSSEKSSTLYCTLPERLQAMVHSI